MSDSGQPILNDPDRKRLAAQALARHVQTALHGRPSPQQRAQARKAKSDRETINTLYQSVDRKGRTRGAKKNAAKLEGKDNEALLAEAVAEVQRLSPPTRLALTDTRLFSGNRDFGQKFRDAFWASQPKPWICALCGGDIGPRQSRGIDHIQPWSVICTGVKTFQVCKDGVHWEVALDEEAQAVNRNVKNLQPAHKSCNSEKSGDKGLDPLFPIRKGDCPDPHSCSLEKAL